MPTEICPSLILSHASQHWMGYLALLLFIIAYIAVIGEEFLHLRKSKPVMIAAALIWVLVAWVARESNQTAIFHHAIENNLLEYVELFLFLIVAMTYVNTLTERNLFSLLRAKLIHMGLSYRQLFWLTGFIAFCLSPIADNLTTALVMGAVIITLGKQEPKFVSLACINIVIAANAGGAFSPFGDITTLMVWQKGHLQFTQFFVIFIPALISFIVPACCMHFALPKGYPESMTYSVFLKRGAITIAGLFLLTIGCTVYLNQILSIPPGVSMMMGLGALQLYGYVLKQTKYEQALSQPHLSHVSEFDIFKNIEQVEWDTLLFFYGIMLCVGGLACLGYLEILSHSLYHNHWQSLSAAHQDTPANILIGLLSAVIDNIPVMYAVLSMAPEFSTGQWLLVTLTAGIGGSLLAVGSAAGVALLGQSKGLYTFMIHLKWSWAILLGYILAITSHLLMNQYLF